MKWIFFLCIFTFHISAYAEWKDAKSLNINSYSEISNEFIIPKETSKKGIEICGVETDDEEINCMVNIRYINDFIDISLLIVKPIWDKSGYLYLEILDEDKYLVDKIFISRISERYTGNLYAKHKMNKTTFYNAKYFRISAKG